MPWNGRAPRRRGKLEEREREDTAQESIAARLRLVQDVQLQMWLQRPEASALAQRIKNNPGDVQVRRGCSRSSYLTSTVAPAPSSCAFALSASSFETFSSTGLGAPSTRSLASLRPRLVSARTS